MEPQTAKNNMAETQNNSSSPYGNLLDFVYHSEGSDPLYVDVAVKEDGQVVVFHNKPFKRDLAWIEYDLGQDKIEFVLEDGEIRNLGIPVNPNMKKYMHNTHQVLMALLDGNTGQALEGYYIPLIMHRSE